MLTLSRRKGERVKIGDIGWVTVVGVRGERVRLGFDFPGDVDVHRAEVAAAIAAQTTDYDESEKT